MIVVAEATSADTDDVIELEARLFAEDSGVHERHANVDWPRRHGADDFSDLVGRSDGVVFLARDDGVAVGLLMGYSTDSSPTRRPIRYAVLRTMYVAETHRRGGLGRRLVDTFLAWAGDQGCVEAQVNHYVANHNAGRRYERAGFEAHSLDRVLHLDRAGTTHPRRTRATD